MRIAYDLHLHSCLSPCGDEDMTPYNLVNMAKLLELDIIALTDHNTCGNCRSAMRAGEEAGIPVIPGMELCTAEEIHMVCLFPELAAAEAFSAYVAGTLPPVNNDPDIFGRQLFMDHRDGVTGEEEILLVTASGIDIGSLPKLVDGYGGFCCPAHIDRPSYSITASLGAIDRTMGFRCAEVSRKGGLQELTERYPDLSGMRILRSSDAHRLEDMGEAQDHLHPPECTPKALVEYLRRL